MTRPLIQLKKTTLNSAREYMLKLINDERVQAYPPMEALIVLNNDDKIAEVCADSFATVMLVVEVDGQYGGFDNEYMTTISYNTLTVGDILQRVADVYKPV